MAGFHVGVAAFDLLGVVSRRGTGGVNIEFIATVAKIAPDPIHSRELYVDALGLPLEGEGDSYRHSERIAGCKSFGIWPLENDTLEDVGGVDLAFDVIGGDIGNRSAAVIRPGGTSATSRPSTMPSRVHLHAAPLPHVPAPPSSVR